MKVFRVGFTGFLLMGSLFLLLINQRYIGVTFTHPNFPKSYDMAWALFIGRMLYTAIMYPLILTVIKPTLRAFGRVNIIHVYLGFEVLNGLDWYFNYMQTPFRFEIGVFLMVITFFYFYENIKNEQL